MIDERVDAWAYQSVAFQAGRQSSEDLHKTTLCNTDDARGSVLFAQKLRQFPRVAAAPLDNKICERILKKAILHRKNATRC
jgi:hypothetical protein